MKAVAWTKRSHAMRSNSFPLCALVVNSAGFGFKRLKAASLLLSSKKEA
jgi:hypothetical protein